MTCWLSHTADKIALYRIPTCVSGLGVIWYTGYMLPCKPVFLPTKGIPEGIKKVLEIWVLDVLGGLKHVDFLLPTSSKDGFNLRSCWSLGANVETLLFKAGWSQSWDFMWRNDMPSMPMFFRIYRAWGVPMLQMRLAEKVMPRFSIR